jgi:UDPglucose--hexose-1-phosphate uridylyltransferase
MNELRRDPMSGRWTIFEHPDKPDIEALLQPEASRPKRESPRNCSFCEGNENSTPVEICSIRKKGSASNGIGWEIRVVADQDPVMSYEGSLNEHGYGLYDVLNAIGAHEILIEHPKHSTHLKDYSPNHTKKVLGVLQQRIIELKQDTRFRYVLFHKQKGESPGILGDHAHSHILATPITPMRVKNELVYAREFYQYKARCIYCDMIFMELRKRERIVREDEDFLAVSPYAAHRPFEIWILPIKHETFFERNTNLPNLSETLRFVVQKIAEELRDPGYTITLHNGPNTSVSHQRGYWKTIAQDYHWHLEIVPDIPSRSNFNPGFDFSVNPVPPEMAAQIFRGFS